MKTDPNSMQSPALACAMGVIPSEQREAHLALMGRLFRDAVQEHRELPDGFEFRFTAHHFPAVAGFVANERKCCPFLQFEIVLSPHDGPVWLRISGPPGTRELLASQRPS